MSIEVSKLTHVYDEGMPTEQIALEDVSFKVEDGEILGIIGHTGSGKSTLLQHLDGLLKPNSGTIVIGGTDITKPGVSLVEIRKRVGLVFQYPEYQLFEETVEKDVAYGPGNLGLSPEEIDERVHEALTLVGLDYETVKDRSPFELSGGQKRAVAIAGVIAMRPQVLILDEPTAGLDPRTHGDILKMIRTIHQKTGNIIILVSHNMGDIAAIADKVLVMDTGRTIAYGTPLEIFSKADELRAVGLDLPPITEFCKKLGITDTVLTVEEAVDKIKDFIGA
ncbi:MAG: energy-coupling factor transporter ATPase [Firmicutes bacterium]|nr:energy-coupling factor transporter ATPase [Bacillota bacterium]